MKLNKAKTCVCSASRELGRYRAALLRREVEVQKAISELSSKDEQYLIDLQDCTSRVSVIDKLEKKIVEKHLDIKTRWATLRDIDGKTIKKEQNLNEMRNALESELNLLHEREAKSNRELEHLNKDEISLNAESERITSIRRQNGCLEADILALNNERASTQMSVDETSLSIQKLCVELESASEEEARLIQMIGPYQEEVELIALRTRNHSEKTKRCEQDTDDCQKMNQSLLDEIESLQEILENRDLERKKRWKLVLQGNERLKQRKLLLSELQEAQAESRKEYAIEILRVEALEEKASELKEHQTDLKLRLIGLDAQTIALEEREDNRYRAVQAAQTLNDDLDTKCKRLDAELMTLQSQWNSLSLHNCSTPKTMQGVVGSWSTGRKTLVGNIPRGSNGVTPVHGVRKFNKDAVEKAANTLKRMIEDEEIHEEDEFLKSDPARSALCTNKEVEAEYEENMILENTPPSTCLKENIKKTPKNDFTNVSTKNASYASRRMLAISSTMTPPPTNVLNNKSIELISTEEYEDFFGDK